jgi:arylsulfatase A-like enzyme
MQYPREVIKAATPTLVAGRPHSLFYLAGMPGAAVRQGDWKLIRFYESERMELYNLKDDVGEGKNLVEVMPEKTRELHELMLAWRKALNAPVPIELNPDYNP